MDGMRACRCGQDGCDRLECVVCEQSECKWPGACYGKCQWCGDPTVASRLPTGDVMYRDDGRPWMQLHCSQSCGSAYWQDGVERGLVVNLSEVTLERANELFGTMGLALDGVGKVQAS